MWHDPQTGQSHKEVNEHQEREKIRLAHEARERELDYAFVPKTPVHQNDLPIVAYLKGRLFLAQYGRCFLCSGWMRNIKSDREAKEGWTFEHLVPVSKGGKRRDNLVLAHAKCNSRRGSEDLTPEQWAKAKRVLALAAQVSPHNARLVERGMYLRGKFIWEANFPIPPT